MIHIHEKKNTQERMQEATKRRNKRHKDAGALTVTDEDTDAGYKRQETLQDKKDEVVRGTNTE